MNISDVEDELLINQVLAIMSAIKKTFKIENKDEQEQHQKKSTEGVSPLSYTQMIEQREKMRKIRKEFCGLWKNNPWVLTPINQNEKSFK